MLENFNNIKITAECTGCLACLEACPTHSIKKITGKDHFFYPFINNETCINCGKCLRVCPLQTKRTEEYNQTLYAAHAISEKARNSGSSGGIFGVIANYLLKQGYYICGAAFDSDLKLRHAIVNDKDGLLRLMKSKYVQSDLSGNYSAIKELLEIGEKVFFCGTPCQVSALKNFIGQSDNLITADIICHGVPSQWLFDQYINGLSKKHSAIITDYSFRVKDNKYKHSNGFRYTYKKDGKEQSVDGIYTDSSFYSAFKEYKIFREACYSCHYTTIERVSDFTLGDFWNLERIDKTANTDLGESLVIINSARGESLFSELPGIKKQVYPIHLAIENNYSLSRKTKKPENYDAIFQHLDEDGYEVTAKKFFSTGKKFKYRIYWKIPPKLRNLFRKIRGLI